jgi:hypothetical protein
MFHLLIILQEHCDIKAPYPSAQDILERSHVWEFSGLRQEMMELGAEMTECRGVMMLMRGALTDATRELKDQKAEWAWEHDLLLQIQSGLLRRLEAVERQVGPSTVDHPIVIEDSEDSRDLRNMEMVVGDEISLWAQNVAESMDNTLVKNQMVYNLVPIEELTGSN